MTLINGFNLVHYLLGKALINYDDLFDHGISIMPIQSRNFSYKVTIPNTTALFVKQVDFPDSDKIETIRMEATCYWLAHNERNYEILKNLFPTYIQFDQYNHILISELFVDALDLASYFRQKDRFELDIAGQLGTMLASYHQGMFEKIKDQPVERLFKKSIPGPFRLFGEQLSIMKPRTEVERQMKELILSQDGFKEKVHKVKEKWMIQSLIHGDIKFQNFLIQTNDQKKEIKLIDWEIADLGDPLWDCAAIIQSYILPWIIHYGGKHVPDLYKEVEMVLPSIHRFWQTYTTLPSMKIESLIKLIEFTAIKLLHTCYETNVYAKSMNQAGAQMLQLSLNMLTEPEQMIQEFFEFKNIETNEYV